MNIKIMTALAIALPLLLNGCKGLEPFLQTAGDVAQVYAKPSEGESVSALKQALQNGVSTAIDTLGQQGGFSDSPFRIPVPEKLQSTAETARKLGLDKYVDDFELSMNRAAEKAVPVASDVFVSAIKQMSVQDVVGILTGPDNAATEYFRQTSGVELEQRFLPIVSEATAKVGVTEQYKVLGSKIETYGRFLGVEAPAVADLDGYITRQSTGALFDVIAEEEKLIRENPVKRTSEILQKVFGYYAQS